MVGGMSSLPAPPAYAPAPSPYPVRIVDHGDLSRSRLTVFFRLLLAIPHLIVVAVWAIAALVVAVVNWIATLLAGQSPEGLHSFLASYQRYSTAVLGYACLLADPWPSFSGAPGSYVLDVEIDPPARQNRLTVLFRGILGIPMYFIASILSNVFQLLVVVSWLVCLVLGRHPEGLQNTQLWLLGVQTRTFAYMLFLSTSRYPGFS